MTLTARAYAKINLYLDITGKRPDGYHELDSIFQSVSLCDEVTLSLCDKGIIVSCDNEELSGESNIVYKACELFLSEAQYSGGVKVAIKKNIPIAAGLAGGSADAAATLYLLNELLSSNFSKDKLSDIALKLGADVPFCLIGGTARVKGIGEKIEQLDTPQLYYVLLKEKEKQSTGKMFKIVDEADYENFKNIEDMIAGLKASNIAVISQNMFNAFAFCWDFENMTEPFKPFEPAGVFLSGSGPTVCAMFDCASKAQNCAKTLREEGYNAFYACSTYCGVEIV